MKAASPALIAYLAVNDQYLYADLFQFTLADGSSYYYSSIDLSLVVNGQTYRADEVRIDGMRYKVAVGLDTDEQTITLSYNPTDLIDGVPWPQALRARVLDGCYLRRSRAFYNAFNQPPVGVVPLFAGRVSTASSVGRVEAQVSVKSMLLLLDTQMPVNTYQTGCVFSLFSAGCTLNKANYAMAWTVAAGPTNGTIPVPSQTPPLPAALPGNTEGLAIMAQGTLLFTSGVNEGVYRTIKSVNAAAPYGLVLAYPLETPPAEGDSFMIWPGCDKTVPTCQNRFKNLLPDGTPRARAYPYTPSAETVY